MDNSAAANVIVCDDFSADTTYVSTEYDTPRQLGGDYTSVHCTKDGSVHTHTEAVVYRQQHCCEVEQQLP